MSALTHDEAFAWEIAREYRSVATEDVYALVAELGGRPRRNGRHEQACKSLAGILSARRSHPAGQGDTLPTMSDLSRGSRTLAEVAPC